MTPPQIATIVALVCCASLPVLAVPTGDHTCTGVTKIPVTVLVNVTVPVTFRSYTWCLRVPPRCSKYTVQLKDRVQLHTEMHNKTITVCCRGFVEMEGKCVPACPEGADCPFMHCNRTNHCHCTPGYTGLYCNDPCPRGVWGKDCKRPCDCPSGYTCHHLTGDCMVDDRPARKTTTTTTTTLATTTTKPPTMPVFTTEATTLETVKTPQFRFPPPPWVEAAGSTTPRKPTTRIVKDDITTVSTQQRIETTATTPMPTVVKQERPPVVEFFPTPENSFTTHKTTITSPVVVQQQFTTSYQLPTKIYLASTVKEEEYLNSVERNVTERTTPTITTQTTHASATTEFKTMIFETSTSPTTTAIPSTSSLPPNSTPMTEGVTTPKNITLASMSTTISSIPTTPTTVIVPSTIATTTTPKSITPTIAQTDPTTVLTTPTTVRTTPMTEVTTPTTVMTTPTTVVTTPVTANKIPIIVDMPTTVITTPTSVVTEPTTVTTPTTLMTTVVNTSPAIVTLPTTVTTQPSSPGSKPTLSETIERTTSIPTTNGTTASEVAPAPDISLVIPITVENNIQQWKTSSTQPFKTNNDMGTHPIDVIKKTTTVSPEFKVIKVIKTDQAQAKPPKFPSTIEQTLTESFLPGNISLKNQHSEESLATKGSITTIIEQEKKLKNDGSPIIYISPTSKEINPNIILQNKVPHSETTVNFQPTTKDDTTIRKIYETTRENEVPRNEFITTDGTFPDRTTAEVPEVNIVKPVNKSILHSLFSEPQVPKEYDLNQNPSTRDHLTKIESTTEISQPTTATAYISSMKTTDQTQDLTTIHLSKKKTKDYSHKKNDDKLETKTVKKVTQESLTPTTLSPIHLLKQLLNATSKPRTTTTIPSISNSISETLPPKAYEDDFTKEIISKKAKYDDLIIPYSSSEKGKKKHEKTKQHKHSKEGKEHSFVTPIKQDKESEIPIPPLELTSTTEIRENMIAETQIPAKTSTIKPNPVENQEENVSLVKPSNSSTGDQLLNGNLPNLINQNAQTTPHMINLKESNRNENNIKVITTEGTSPPVTENNNAVESNTIGSLHTPFEAMAKKGLEEEQEDSNYSIINNKMKLVKTETSYGAAGMTGTVPPDTSFSAMLLTAGIASVTLIALTGTVWVYLRRRRRNATATQPCIMAYELPEPTPIDIHSLEQTFFCPTFTNNYAERINRELQELSYDHPRKSQPEPLYAEIRH